MDGSPVADAEEGVPILLHGDGFPAIVDLNRVRPVVEYDHEDPLRVVLKEPRIFADRESLHLRISRWPECEHINDRALVEVSHDTPLCRQFYPDFLPHPPD